MRHKRKEYNLYHNLNKFKETRMLDAYFVFIKSNVFHVFFNALITVIILEVFVFYSGIFSSKQIIPLENFVTYVLLIPVCVVLTIAIIYTILFAGFSMNRINNFLNISKTTEKKDLKLVEELFIEKYNIYILFFNILGVFLYSLSGFLASKLLFNYNDIIKTYISDENTFVWGLTIIAMAWGIIWNISSFFGMKRINWSKIMPNIDKQKAKTQSFYCLFRQAISEIIAIVFVLILFVYSFLSFTNIETINDDSLTYLNIILAIISALVFTYIKILLKLEFSSKADKIIYPTVKNLL